MAEYYPATGCRPFNDLDLYVTPEDVTATREVLAAAGFQEREMRNVERIYLLVATTSVPGWERRRPGQPIERVDIARQLLLPAMQTSSNDPILREMFIRKRQEADGLPVLSPPDLLLDLTLNHFVCCTTLHYVHLRRFQRLRLYLDVLLSARMLDCRQWDLFDDMVTTAGLGEVVTAVFTNCVEVFPNAPRSEFFDRWYEPGANNLIGHYELQTPYRWQLSVRERLILDALPASVPPSQSP
jgi:hypothetical protein